MEERDGSVVRVNEGEDGRSAVAAAVFVGPPVVGGGGGDSPARRQMTAGERLGVRVSQGKGEMAGHRP